MSRREGGLISTGVLYCWMCSICVLSKKNHCVLLNKKTIVYSRCFVLLMCLIHICFQGRIAIVFTFSCYWPQMPDSPPCLGRKAIVFTPFTLRLSPKEILEGLRANKPLGFDGSHNAWICKPGHGSRGRGIRVFNDLPQVTGGSGGVN